MASDSSEESVDDDSEWPPEVQLPVSSHKVDWSPTEPGKGKRPYCGGGRRGQPRWLGIDPASSGHEADPRGNTSDSDETVVQDISERPVPSSNLGPDLPRQLTLLDQGMFSKAFDMLIRDLHFLSVNAQQLKDLHWKAMGDHGDHVPEYGEAIGTSTPGLELAALLEKLDIGERYASGTNPKESVGDSLRSSCVSSITSHPRQGTQRRKTTSSQDSVSITNDMQPRKGDSQNSAGQLRKSHSKHSSMKGSRRHRSEVSGIRMQHIPSRLSSWQLNLREAWIEIVDTPTPVLLSLSTIPEFSKSHLSPKHTTERRMPSILQSDNCVDWKEKRNYKLNFVLHPHGTLRLTWNLCCLALIFYDVIVVPLHAFDFSSLAFFREVEWVITVLWTLDILVSFKTGYKNGVSVVLDPRRIAVHYAQGWLAADLVIVALEWLARISGEFLGFGNILRVRCISSLRIGKAVRLAKLKASWTQIENRVNSNLLLLCLGLLKMTLALLVMIHFITCMWYAIGESSPHGWTSYYDPFKSKSIPFWYFASTRWTLAQINGRTDVDERRTQTELWYTCLVAIIFAMIFMSIYVSSITSTMVELSAAAEAEASTGKLLDDYLGYYQVDKALIQAVKAYMRDTRRMDDEDSELKFLGRLPRQLANDLICEIHQPTLVNNAYFNDLGQEYPRVISKICSGDSGTTYNIQVHKWEMVFDIGDACSRLLFVERGHVIYCSDLEVTTKQAWSPNYQDPDAARPPGMDLLRRSWMSESALWVEWINHGRCIAATRSSLLAVDAFMFAELISDYKEVHAKACFYAKTFVEALAQQKERSDIFLVEITYGCAGNPSDRFSIGGVPSRISQGSTPTT